MEIAIGGSWDMDADTEIAGGYFLGKEGNL